MRNTEKVTLAVIPRVGWSESTLSNAIRSARIWDKWYQTTKGLKNIAGFITVMQASGKQRNSTIMLYLTNLRMIYNHAIRLGIYRGKNPFSYLPALKIEQRKPYLIQPVEQAMIMATIRSNPSWDEWEIPALLGWHFGMRKSDAISRRWEDFDLRSGSLTFVERKNRRHQRQVVVPLGKEIIDALLGWKSRQPEPIIEELAGYVSPMLYLQWKQGIFRSMDSTTSSVADFSAVTKKALGKKVLFAEYRPTLVTRLLEAGVAETVVC